MKKYRYTDQEIRRNEEIENIFRLFDTDGSGSLEIDEIERVVSGFRGDV